jgi:predicted TIM-barrel fold metal-dependent hydrolase
MDIEGIDVAVLFRGLGGHVIAIDGMEPDFAAALCRAYNRYAADHCTPAPNRMKATAVVPLHDVKLAVKEAEYAVGKLGHIAIVLPGNPVNGRNLNDHYYDPLWQAACDLNVPIAVHSIQGAYGQHIANRFLDNLSMMHATAHAFELMMSMGAMICGGVFDRCPKLRAAFLEGNCGWLGWWLWKLDEEKEKFGAAEFEPIQDKPSAYYRRHCFVAVDPDELPVAQVVQTVGDDTIVLSTDWPHDDSLYPKAIDTFLAMDGISADSKRKILWDNCTRLYKVGSG